MKWMIASDIHGSAKYASMLLARFEEEQADRLLLLGDLLYHGPRNDLPPDYAPKEVAAALNRYSSRILCVRGNCEAEVDQLMFDFPVMAEYALMPYEERLIFMTHGHVFNKQNPPALKKGDMVLMGHTHVPGYEEASGLIFINPGSCSIPKDGSRHSYMMFDSGVFMWKDLEDGSCYMKYELRQPD